MSWVLSVTVYRSVLLLLVKAVLVDVACREFVEVRHAVGFTPPNERTEPVVVRLECRFCNFVTPFCKLHLLGFGGSDGFEFCH